MREGLLTTARRSRRLAGKSRIRRDRRLYQKKSRGRPWRVLAWLASLSALAVAAVLFDDSIKRANHPRIDAHDTTQVETGQRIYAKWCSTCHGPSLEGAQEWPQRSLNGRLAAPPLGNTGRAWRWRDAQLFSITRDGPAAYPPDYGTDMPAFGRSLTDDEIAAVLAYAKSQWSAEVQAQHARINLLPWTKIEH